ncbi:MerR family transcriptional regulator [Kordia algicida OT-1]|uniref:Probable transcriptional regulator, MerR family protein n=1 Tax=Kordia algicida OT-1 TaxID=391587 RepID=A9E5U8_9FLAO|nr:MerR family transcriptional regulator [Kordia algicida]EDP95222.1 probable transcriptional regulator, MerR family protein [Kordia algicida OT-1]
MECVKTKFSIKDLENLSGVKAHTIRIWEKRYNLLAPDRTNTNIRTYDIKSLQKLLNITLLYKNGYKISKIAEIPEDKIHILVREIATEKNIHNQALNSFKLSMLNFDYSLFYNTYNKLLAEKSFREIFYDTFIPLLNELGVLWHTQTINPAHEHFISSLVKQKIILNTERIQSLEKPNKTKTFVLFLPENEIHEIGLLYLNYELQLKGYHTIYLGQTIPIDSLTNINNFFPELHFISYFTVTPPEDKIEDYLQEFSDKVGFDNNYLWLLGYQARHVKNKKNHKNLRVFKSIIELVEEI